MASRFPFVERNRSLERKSREQELDDLRRELAVMGGPPLSQRVLDTGTGGNGRVDVNKPTHVLNTNVGPRTVHEKERVNIDPRTGQFDVTPASQFGGQENLQRIEKATGMPGFQLGTEDFRDRGPAIGAGIAATEGALQDTGAAIGAGVAEATGPVTGDLGPAIGPGITTTEGIITTPGEAPGATQPIPIAPTPTPIFQPPQTGVAAPRPQPVAPVPTPVSAPVPAPPAPQPTYEPFATRGLQRLERYTEGRDPFAEQIRGAERERFAGEAAAARGALGQELGQLGIGGREAVTAQARLGRQIGADEASLMAELRTQEAEQAFKAAMALPGAAASAEGQRTARDYFNLAKGQDDYKRMTDAFNALAEAGNYDEAAAMFGEMFPGSTIDLSKLATEEARLDFSKGMENVSSYVASGLTWTEAIDAMRQDGTFDLLGMDEANVKGMYDALITSTDDVGRWTKNQSDPRLQAMFPDLWEEGGREAVEGKLAKLHYFGAITFDENGKISWDRELLAEILGEPTGVTPPSGPQPTQTNIDTFRETYGVTEATDERISQYLATNPETVSSVDFTQWDRRNPDPARIESYMFQTPYADTGKAMTTLRDTDRLYLESVIDAYNTPTDERTEDQAALINAMPDIMATGQFAMENVEKNAHDAGFIESVPTGPEGYATTTFTKDAIAWIQNNKGKVITYNGKNYLMDATTPWGSHHPSDKHTIVTLNVIDLATGILGMLDFDGGNYLHYRRSL